MRPSGGARSDPRAPTRTVAIDRDSNGQISAVPRTGRSAHRHGDGAVNSLNRLAEWVECDPDTSATYRGTVEDAPRR